MGDFYFFTSLINLLVENQDAILAVPTEIKFIVVGGFALMIISSFIKKAWRLFEFCCIVALIYYFSVCLQLI